MCQHENVTEEGYLNSCQMAGCQLNGPVTYHKNCGQQWRTWCDDCGAMLYDSADEPVERKPELYMCRECEENGIQAGHKYCGQFI